MKRDFKAYPILGDEERHDYAAGELKYLIDLAHICLEIPCGYPREKAGHDCYNAVEVYEGPVHGFDEASAVVELVSKGWTFRQGGDGSDEMDEDEYADGWWVQRAYWFCPDCSSPDWKCEIGGEVLRPGAEDWTSTEGGEE